MGTYTRLIIGSNLDGGKGFLNVIAEIEIGKIYYTYLKDLDQEARMNDSYKIPEIYYPASNLCLTRDDYDDILKSIPIKEVHQAIIKDVKKKNNSLLIIAKNLIEIIMNYYNNKNLYVVLYDH